MSEYRPRIEFIVIAGMAKTGTTLPLTLLDGHPALSVFPEELRFFHLNCHNGNGTETAKRLLNNGNIINLSRKDEYFHSKDYLAHGGTGFGRKDYKDFDFDHFKELIQSKFKKENSAFERFQGIMNSFIQCNDQLNSEPERIIFVSKAPHNEVYINEWENMLGKSVKYILCTRLPTEHYASLKNVAALQGKKMDAYKYVSKVKERAKLWCKFPEDRTFILDYDMLTNSPKSKLLELSDFIGISYNEKMSEPTKFGIPWGGNSSRGIVEEKVFVNKHIAEEKLSRDEFLAIEYLLQDFYKKNGWNQILKQLSRRKKAFFTTKYIYKKALINFKKAPSAAKRLISAIIPRSTKQSIKSIINS